MSLQTRNLAPLLPYWDLTSEGVMFNLDGTIEVGVEYTLPPATFMTDAEFTRQWQSMSNVLRFATPVYGRSRIMIESHTASKASVDQYADSLDPNNHDVMAQLVRSRVKLMQERRVEGKIKEWRYVITVARPTRKKSASGVLLRLLGYGKENVSYTRREFDNLVKQGVEMRERLVRLLKAARLDPVPMGADDIKAYVHRYLNNHLAHTEQAPYIPPEARKHEFLTEEYLKKNPRIRPNTFKTQVARTPIFVNNHTDLQIGPDLIRTVSLQKVPTTSTELGMIQDLINDLIGRNFYLMMDHQHDPAAITYRKLEAKARRANAMNKDQTLPYNDPTNEAAQTNIEAAMIRMDDNDEHPFQSSLTAVLFGRTPTELDSATEDAVNAMSRITGTSPIVGGTQNPHIFLKDALPFNGTLSSLAFPTLQANSVDFFPLMGPWRGQANPTVMFDNRWGGATGIDPFSPLSLNFNGVIIGGSGAGKTFFTQAYVASLRARETEIIIVDRGGSYQSLVDTCGGSTITLTPGETSINMFDLPEAVHKPDEEKQALILSILRTMVPEGSDEEKEALENAVLENGVDQTYQRALQQNMTPDQKIEYVFHTPLLENLVGTLESMSNVGGRELGEQETAIARSLGTRLRSWLTGPYAAFVNRPTNIDTSNPVLYIETAGLEAHEKLGTLAMLLVTDMIWKRAKLNFNRKLVVLDEAWALLSNKYARQLVIELFRRCRKYNMGVYAISQSINDFNQIPGLLQSATYHFIGILPNEEEELAESLKLSTAASAAHSSLRAIPGEYAEYLAWIRTPFGLEGDVIRLIPSRLEYWMFTTKGSEVQMRNEMLARTGGDIMAAVEILAGVRTLNTLPPTPIAA